MEVDKAPNMWKTVNSNRTMNTLEDMHILAATVDAESFTGAAERLGLSKQYVSRRVMALEARLGVRLLNRSTRRLSVTDVGREYYERVVKILDEVSDAELAATRQNASPRGALRVTAPMSFGTLHLSPLLPAFLARHPELRIEIDLNDRTVDLIGEGYDMAIRVGVLRDSSLVARQIASTRMVACCSPGYLARRGAPASPAALKDFDCLLYGHGPSVEWTFAVQGRPAPVAVTGRLRANNGELARDAAIAGEGIAWLPTFIVCAALQAGRLVTVLDGFAPPPVGVYAIYPSHRQASLAIRAFTDFLRGEFGREAHHF
jgi:DNA-binding transcriptional LysR family regulator